MKTTTGLFGAVTALLLTAACQDTADPLSYFSEAELAGVTFRLSAIREQFTAARALRSCSGVGCRIYDGRFRVRVETSKPFGPVEKLPLEHAPNLSMFGPLCSVFPDPGEGLTQVEMECPFSVDGVMPAADATIWFEPKLPGLYDPYPGDVEFPGTFDSATFPTTTVD